MSSTLTIDGKEYVTAVVAGKKFGYTKDYFLMLAKQGKIDGQKVGNKWYIQLNSAELFFNENKKRKKERSEKIRAERKLEFQQHTKIKKHDDHKSYAKAAVVETLIILVIGLSLGATGYFGVSKNVASVQSGEYGFFETLAVSVYNFFSPQSKQVIEKTYVTQQDNGNEKKFEGNPKMEEESTPSGLVVAPEEVFHAASVDSIEQSFSDEVNVIIDSDNPDSGVIVPVFKDREGENYRFLMVPVNKSSE
jgi:hypothetical protein